MNPTAEQLNALDLFSTGESLVIEAGAGTGKTSTLVLLAKSTNRRGQYIAFNKAIVDESRTKFSSNVNCSTAHSLAYRAIAVGTPFVDRMKSGKRMRSIDQANLLGIDAIRVRLNDEERLLSSSFLAGVVMSTCMRFCQSADAEITYRHVPRIPGLDADGEYTINNQIAKQLVPYAHKAWADLTNHHGRLPFTTTIAMSVYLKLWQLSEPRIGADFILFDEAQDANPVMVDVVAKQKHAQLVWVGDSQQQIYAFTGAINALAHVPADHRTFLTQSFRFGPAVAEVANQVLNLIESAELRIVGFEQINSVVAPVAEPNVVLTRTNAEAVRTVLAAIAAEKSFHLVGGGKDVIAFCEAAIRLQAGERVDHPELAPFEDWAEVQTYVDEDEQGNDLKLLVKLIDEFAAAVILDALRNQAEEQDADLVVSTAHKSKGRQWGSVQLAGDFDENKIAKSDDEKRLLYVAVTRAQFELDIEAIPFLRDSYRPEAEKAEIVATTEAKAKVEATATIETIKAPESNWVGRLGETIEAELSVVSVGNLTRYDSYPTVMVDADGNQVKAFLREQLAVGTTYHVEGRVKEHGEFRGVKETTVNYVRVIEEVGA